MEDTFGGVDLSPEGEWEQFTVSADQTKQVNRLEFSTWETDPIYIDDVSFCSDTVIHPIATEPETITERQTISETTSEVKTVIITIEEEDISPIPGFMALPVIVSLIIVALMYRRRRM